MILIEQQWQDQYQAKPEIVIVCERASVGAVNFTAAMKEAQHGAFYSPNPDGQHDDPDELVQPLIEKAKPTDRK